MVDQNKTYTFIKDGVYYFSKRVPKDLHSHYQTHRLVLCLHTRSASKASFSARSLLAKLEDYWLKIRLSEMEVPASHRLVVSAADASQAITLNEALDLYLRLKGYNKQKQFEVTAKRHIQYVVKCLRNRPIDLYSTADGSTFRDWLVNKGLSDSSVKRTFSSVKAIVNLAISESGLACKNAFSGVYMPDRSDSVKRSPITNPSLVIVKSECIRIDDDLRWLIALISDSGLRLSEAIGLIKDDIVIRDGVSYIIVRAHKWRPLKTAASERIVPLVGMSEWSARRLLSQVEGDYCFPRYASKTGCRSNSASAALNKWLKKQAGSDATVHGFRHSIRDRLRNVEAPTVVVK
jgi:integrase